jgi:transcriptional regulator with XRE-family HTH domain
MGSASRGKPEKLGKKLLSIRQSFGYSFSQMAEQLSDDKIVVLRTNVYRFEKGLREPSLIVLLRYARLVNISLDVLADNELKLNI